MIKEIEHIIWSYLAIPTLLIVSLIFTFYYRGAQFRFKEMIKCLTKKTPTSEGVSSFQSFTMALAARVGVGSLAGVALGIYIGGPGSVFGCGSAHLLQLPLRLQKVHLPKFINEKMERCILEDRPTILKMAYIKNLLLSFTLLLLF